MDPAESLTTRRERLLRAFRDWENWNRLFDHVEARHLAVIRKERAGAREWFEAVLADFVAKAERPTEDR